MLYNNNYKKKKKKVAAKLNACSRFISFTNFSTEEALVKTFVYLQFNTALCFCVFACQLQRKKLNQSKKEPLEKPFLRSNKSLLLKITSLF